LIDAFCTRFSKVMRGEENFAAHSQYGAGRTVRYLKVIQHEEDKMIQRYDSLQPFSASADNSTLAAKAERILLNTQEAAAYVRRSSSSLAKARVEGSGIRYYKVGRRVYYDKADLDVWLSSRIRRSTSDMGPRNSKGGPDA
jgi:hypothetical protein